LLGQLPAVDLGEPDVGEQQIDALRAANHLDGCAGIGCIDDVIAELFE
jgi:hypothetical protein